MSTFERSEQAAQFILGHTPLRPRVALVLGSGLGEFADELNGSVRIAYKEIPHFPRTSVEGHAGRIVIGKLGEIPLAVMQGRVHLYEGLPISEVIFPIRVLGRMGIRTLVVTSAVGGINPSLKAGSFVVLADNINLQPVNPLAGPHDERFGPRFPDMTEAYSSRFREIALTEGRRLELEIGEGVYAALSGPNYETPAEIRFLRIIGADVVGMSTVPEVLVARQMGIEVLAISCVTNLAAGVLDQPITHTEVLEAGRRMKPAFTAMLKTVIPRIASATKTNPGDMSG